MVDGWVGVVGMRRVTQAVLPLLPAEAVAIGPVAGLVEGPEGGVVFVAGMATFAFDAGDEVGRRLAAVQLVATKIASAVAVADGFGVSVVNVRSRLHGRPGVSGASAHESGHPARPNSCARHSSALQKPERVPRKRPVYRNIRVDPPPPADHRA